MNFTIALLCFLIIDLTLTSMVNIYIQTSLHTPFQVINILDILLIALSFVDFRLPVSHEGVGYLESSAIQVTFLY